MPQTRRLSRKIMLEGGCAYLRTTSQPNDRRLPLSLQTWEVVNGNAVLARYRQAVQKQAGLIRLADINAWEGPRRAVTDADADSRTAIDIAARAIRHVRSLLRKGPFNNRGGRADDNSRPYLCTDLPGWSRNPATDNARNLALSGFLCERTPSIGPRDSDFMLALACFAKAAETTGGGVCTFIMSLTVGYLMTIAPAGTEILGLWYAPDETDHQFTVISVNRSPWYVVDPWTLNSFVCRWEAGKAAFPPEQAKIGNYHKVEIVGGPTALPYGVTFGPGVVDHCQRTAEAEIEVVPGEMGAPYGNCCNLAGSEDHGWANHRPNACKDAQANAAPANSRPAATWQEWGIEVAQPGIHALLAQRRQAMGY